MFRRIILPIAFLTLSINRSVVGQPSIAFDEPPVVTLTMEKRSFRIFEPIVVTISAKNASAKQQFFGPVLGGSSGFEYVLRAPDGAALRLHGIFRPIEGEPFGYIPYDPGQTRTAKMPILLNWPVWDDLGTYAFEVHFLVPHSNDIEYELLARIEFSVYVPEDVPTDAVDRLRSAANEVLGLAASFSGALDSILANDSLPAEYAHLARFLDGVRRWREPDGWDEFVTTYPDSPWRVAASNRLSGIVRHRGATPYWTQFKWPSLLTVRVLLETGVSQDTMAITTIARRALPIAQPFQDMEFPLHYGSVERRWDKYPSDFDWILVTLVNADSTDTSVVARSAALVASNGWSHAQFFNVSPGRYRVMVQHRNHVAIMSDSLVDMSYDFGEHDFTTGHAYGSNAQKRVISGGDTTYVMWAGDANADGIVNDADLSIWRATRDTTGYVATDFDLDGTVTAADSTLWSENAKRGVRTGVPEGVWRALFGK